MLENYDNLEMNWVGDYIGKKAKVKPGMVGVWDVTTNTEYTNKVLDDRASRLATYLVDTLRLRKGDRVALISRNNVESIDLFFACAKIGAILCPISYRLQKPEIQDLLKRESPGVVFIEAMFQELVGADILPNASCTRIVFGEGSTDGGDAYARILATAPRPVKVPLAMNDIFLYVHTGGTTGTPKICKISHRQMLWNAIEYLFHKPNVTIAAEANFFPFFHIGGWNVFFCLFMKDATTVILRQFDAGQVLDLIGQKKITSIGVVEAMLHMIEHHPKFESTDLSNLEYILTAAAPCSDETLRPFWERNVPSGQAYGLTEAGPSNFIFVPQSRELDYIETNASTVGTPYLCCDYQIVDPNDRRKVLPRGQIGVLCLRSAHNFSGYLDNPEGTSARIDRDGWVYSGDLAFEDVHGLVSIIGRADNVFNSGGENISPEEIENVLRRHPAVQSALCAGIPDKKWGAVPAGVVVLRPGNQVSTEELMEFCLSRLAKFKVPKYLEIDTAIPLTPVGKPDRTALKRRFMAQALD